MSTMQDSLDIFMRLGQFALLVIIACVGVMLFISMMDRHPRDKDRHDAGDKK